MATIKDVAKRAGLSKSLVSRYLIGRKGVSPESRERIQAAIRELNYRPSGIARSLVSQKTHMIGVVVDDLRSPFLFKLIEGLERGAAEFDKDQNYNVVFCNSNGDIQRKQRHVSFLTQGRVDGVVIYGSFVEDDTLIRELADSGFPFVLIENDIEGVDANKIVIDNVGGAYAATEHLIQLGHRRIAHIGGDRNLKITEDRLAGYKKALRAYKIPITNDWIIFPKFDSAQNSQKVFFEKGYEEMRKLISRGALPDAIFFATDLSAFGAIKALEEANRKVPDDISIVGFDDENPAFYNFHGSPITTVRQPLLGAGYRGIQKLIGSIEHPETPHERILLETKLVVRASARSRRQSS